LRRSASRSPRARGRCCQRASRAGWLSTGEQTEKLDLQGSRSWPHIDRRPAAGAAAFRPGGAHGACGRFEDRARWRCQAASIGASTRAPARSISGDGVEHAEPEGRYGSFISESGRAPGGTHRQGLRTSPPATSTSSGCSIRCWASDAMASTAFARARSWRAPAISPQCDSSSRSMPVASSRRIPPGLAASANRFSAVSTAHPKPGGQRVPTAGA